MIRLGTGILLTLVLAVLVGAPAQAATITVDTETDSFDAPGECSLRSAVYAADKNVATGGCPAGNSTPRFDLPRRVDTVLIPGGRYVLSLPGTTLDDGSGGDLDISSNGTTRIHPSGRDQRVTIDGGGQDRIFDISGLLVQMHELTLRNGAAKGTAVDDGGGAVRMMAGTFLVRGMLFANNRSESDGGAVLLSESRSIFSNSTFSANAADGSGGAVAVIAPTADYSGGTFASVTVAFNKADFDGDGSGHGGGFAISGPNSVVFAINSVLARNQDRSPDVPSRAPDCFAPDSGLSPMYLMSTQALGTPKCPVPPDGPYIRQFSPVDAKLRPLAGNGGPTRTHAIGVRSPAAGANRILNSHNELMCVTRDQRRRPRALGNCDLGAFQVHGATDPVRRISSRTALDLGSDVLLPVRCPARFRLECRAVVSIVVGGRRGRTAGSRTIRASSERSRAIAVTLRRPFRRRLAALTHEPGRYMLVRQVFTVTRDAVRRNPGRPVVVWKRYRLRAYASPGGF